MSNRFVELRRSPELDQAQPDIRKDGSIPIPIPGPTPTRGRSPLRVLRLFAAGSFSANSEPPREDSRKRAWRPALPGQDGSAVRVGQPCGTAEVRPAGFPPGEDTVSGSLTPSRKPQTGCGEKAAGCLPAEG